MSESEKEQLMHLLELNMKESYMETPSGWNRQEKESEMFDPAARHLVLLSRDEKIAAFSHFRFDMDYGVDVIYCYEIHIKECFQRKGIGRFLMEVLEHLMFVFGLSKLVLTVFKSNKNAIGFYTKIGFSIDETSPEDTHYLIMSKLNAKK